MKTPIRTMGEAKYLRKGDFDEKWIRFHLRVQAGRGRPERLDVAVTTKSPEPTERA